MLRMLCLTGFVLFTINSFSQTTKTVTSQKSITPKPATPKVLKDLRDSASYTAGIHIVNKYRSQNVFNFNSAVCARAVDDLQSGKPQLISNTDADNAALAYQSQLMSNPNPMPKTPVSGVVLKDVRDSASYAAGIYLINFFRQFDITNFNSSIIARAITDLQSQKSRYSLIA